MYIGNSRKQNSMYWNTSIGPTLVNGALHHASLLSTIFFFNIYLRDIYNTLPERVLIAYTDKLLLYMKRQVYKHLERND